jgi:CheY-like chemotaxis protein
LLVDDNPDTLEMYGLGLLYEGFQVMKASDGETALQIVAGRRPDCIVADVRMPRMTGLEFRRVLGGSPQTADIPVIALTGFGSPAEIEAAKAAGFQSVLLKPCLPEALAREIVRVLAASRRPRADATDGGSRNADLARKTERSPDAKRSDG